MTVLMTEPEVPLYVNMKSRLKTDIAFIKTRLKGMTQENILNEKHSIEELSLEQLMLLMLNDLKTLMQGRRLQFLQPGTLETIAILKNFLELNDNRDITYPKKVSQLLSDIDKTQKLLRSPKSLSGYIVGGLKVLHSILSMAIVAILFPLCFIAGSPLIPVQTLTLPPLFDGLDTLRQTWKSQHENKLHIDRQIDSLDVLKTEIDSKSSPRLAR